MWCLQSGVVTCDTNGRQIDRVSSGGVTLVDGSVCLERVGHRSLVAGQGRGFSQVCGTKSADSV